MIEDALQNIFLCFLLTFNCNSWLLAWKHMIISFFFFFFVLHPIKNRFISGKWLIQICLGKQGCWYKCNQIIAFAKWLDHTYRYSDKKILIFRNHLLSELMQFQTRHKLQLNLFQSLTAKSQYQNQLKI